MNGMNVNHEYNILIYVNVCIFTTDLHLLRER